MNSSERAWLLSQLPGVSASTPGTDLWRMFAAKDVGETAYPLPQRFYIPGNALLALECDDIDASMFTQFAALGDISPFEYARRQGIPITLACIGKQIEADGSAAGLTKAQLYQAYRYGGFELANHTYDHETAPTTDAQYNENVIKTRDLVESINDGTADAGAVCRGFVKSGNWTTGDASLDNDDKWALPLGRLIKSTHEWAVVGAYGATIANDAPMYADMSTRYGIKVSYPLAAANAAGVDAFLANSVSPGSKKIILFHKIVVSGATGNSINVATFKALIDALATTYAGKINCVTITTLIESEVEPTKYAGTTEIKRKWGGLGCGYFEDMTLGAVTPKTWLNGMYVEASTGDAATIEAPGDGSIDHGYPDTKCLHLVRTTATQNFGVQFYRDIEGGRTYRLSFDWRSSDADGVTGNGVCTTRLTMSYINSKNEYVADHWFGVGNRDVRESVPTSWTRRHFCFGVPKDAVGIQIELFISGITEGEKVGYKLNNVELVRM